MYVHHVCVWPMPTEARGLIAGEALKLELWIVTEYNMGAGNRTL